MDGGVRLPQLPSPALHASASTPAVLKSTYDASKHDQHKAVKLPPLIDMGPHSNSGTSPTAAEPISPGSTGSPSSGHNPQLHHGDFIHTSRRHRIVHENAGQLTSRSSGSHPTLLRGGLNQARVMAIIEQVPSFQDLSQATKSMLPSIMNYVCFSAGTVLHRENDPPGCCYVVLSGEVGLYHKLEHEDTSKQANHLGNGNDSEDQASLSSRHGGSFRRRSDETRASNRSIQAEAVALPCPTVEGFSTYTERADLGLLVERCQSKSLVGELALLHNAPRAVSAKLLQDSELLEIPKESFDTVLRQELLRAGDSKEEFLMEHVPGMRKVCQSQQRALRAHDGLGYLFKRRTFQRGHVFIEQGQVAEDAIYVISGGSVGYHCRRGDLLPPKPPKAGKLVTSQSAGMMPPAGTRLPAIHPGLEDPLHLANPGLGHGARLGLLVQGGVFGALPMQKNQSSSFREPFSVIAAETCEAYTIVGHDAVQKLPPQLVSAIREFLSSSMAWRLGQLEPKMLSAKQQQSNHFGKPKQAPICAVGANLLDPVVERRLLKRREHLRKERRMLSQQ